MNWALLLDPVALAVVLGGTVAATVLRCGPASCAVAAAQVARATRPGFDRDAVKAGLARQVAAIHRDGPLRAREEASGDAEFDAGNAAMLRARSIADLLENHRSHARERVSLRERTLLVFDTAGDLAPMFGLAGTLLALSQLPGDGAIEPTALLSAIGAAVVSTLYGVLAAHLLFYPVARWLDRRMWGEEAARAELIAWLTEQVEPDFAGGLATAGR